VSVALVIAIGAAISSWQFTMVMRLTKRITAIDDRLINVYRVRADVGALRRHVADLARDKDLVKFNAAIDSSHRELLRDISEALASFRRTTAPVPETLSALGDTVADQLDAMQHLAEVNDWRAVRLRIDNQLEDIVDDVRAMVDFVASGVYAERLQCLRDIEAARARAQGILAATAALSLLISLALGFRVTRGITGPLSRLDAAARRLAAGDFDVKIHVDSKDELGKLGEALSVAARELKTYYAALRRSNDDLERFAYAASHDLQEPLRTILSFSSLLKARCGANLGSQGEQYLTFIMDASARMRNLITGILEYSRLTGSKEDTFETVQVDAIVSDVLNNLHATINQTGAQIECDDLPSVLGSRVQLTQLFQNLIGNGIKYRRQDKPLEIRISSEPDGRMRRFCVADNGIGIDPRYHDQIFGMFKQLARDPRGGAGVGLAIAKRIVEKHGGAIWVESTLDNGSRFFFTLGAAEANGPGTVAILNTADPLIRSLNKSVKRLV
jgi:signal transduction histidine kinase